MCSIIPIGETGMTLPRNRDGDYLYSARASSLANDHPRYARSTQGSQSRRPHVELPRPSAVGHPDLFVSVEIQLSPDLKD
ncbi:hypothetical protein RRG08_052426 [Elysia crispata]|uniref:Uncharacterized protein n=1 Tax=Elysia crispata TaxID=231223 RepID=A0AAE1B2S4_9GAST|nr:hypothetical protein RRG08_052426 [Elysia crispata]